MYLMKNIDGKESNTANRVNIATEFNEFKRNFVHQQKDQAQNEENSKQKA